MDILDIAVSGVMRSFLLHSSLVHTAQLSIFWGSKKMKILWVKGCVHFSDGTCKD